MRREDPGGGAMVPPGPGPVPVPKRLCGAWCGVPWQNSQSTMSRALAACVAQMYYRQGPISGRTQDRDACCIAVCRDCVFSCHHR